jgi:hypothetical protein
LNPIIARSIRISSDSITYKDKDQNICSPYFSIDIQGQQVEDDTFDRLMASNMGANVELKAS